MRFQVTKVLPSVWEIHDAERFVTEFVLFADPYYDGCERLFMTDEMLPDVPREEILRLMRNRARQSGVVTSLRLPSDIRPMDVQASLQP